MRLFSKSTLALLGGALALAGCTNDDLCSGADARLEGETMPVSLTVARPADATRTKLTQTPDGTALTSVWKACDRLLVVNASGQRMGELTLDSGEESATGVFSGVLDGVVADSDCRVWYLGAESPYTVATDGENGVVTITTSFATDEMQSVSGHFDDLKRADLMTETVKISVVDGKAYNAENVTLAPRHAMAHFTLSGLPAEVSENATLTVSSVKEETNVLPYGMDGETKLCGDDYGYNVTGVEYSGGTADVYLPFIPGEYAFTFDFKDGDKHFAYTFEAASTLEAGKYYTSTADGEPGQGISVAMAEIVNTPEEPVIDDMVGPIIEVNGKRWRFTRGNLKYTLSAEAWTVLDTQYDFVNAGGLGTDEKTSSTGLGSTPDEIGLFAWGATGVQDARKPWAIRFDDSSQSVGGGSWPSSVQSNSSITNTLDPKWGYVYDFGHAYMANGRAADDDREYITPPVAAFKILMEGCFVQGATLKRMGENGTDVTGLLCIPGKYSLAEAKEFINSIEGASCLSSMQMLLHNKTDKTLQYTNITITDYEALKKLNDAVFFPAASKRNLSGGKVYNSNNAGWYWTSGGTGTNGYNLYFEEYNGNGFFYTPPTGSGSNKASMGRFNQMAIRLLVEVKD